MKLIQKLIKVSFVLLLGFSLNAFAAANTSSLHATKHAANASSKQVRSAGYLETEVHVLNSSSQVITVRVPGVVYDKLYPSEIEDIYSDVYFDAVEVILYDQDGFEFFHDYVPNHETLEVRDIWLGKSLKAGKQQSKVQAVIKK